MNIAQPIALATFAADLQIYYGQHCAFAGTTGLIVPKLCVNVVLDAPASGFAGA